MPQSKRKPSVTPDPVADRLWVEELAMLFEAYGGGFPRTAGRILALLLISTEATTTQAELAEALGVSQASVSTALRHLVAAGYVERTRTPGVRREQYRLRDQSWSTILHTAALAADSLIRHLERGLALPGPDLSAGRVQLLKLTGYHRRLRDLLHEAAARSDD